MLEFQMPKLTEVNSSLSHHSKFEYIDQSGIRCFHFCYNPSLSEISSQEFTDWNQINFQCSF